MSENMVRMQSSNEKSLELLRTGNEKKLEQMRTSNEKSLEEMRETVDAYISERKTPQISAVFFNALFGFLNDRSG